MTSLFSPVTFRGVTLPNRLAVAPMCQYSAVDGLANDWHLVHLGRFALGGFGLVTVEATGVTAEGRISYADLGLWSDAQIPALARIADFLQANGAVPAIQLAHAGRKASSPVPFRPTVREEEKAAVGYAAWTPVAPSPLPHSPTYTPPAALDEAGIRGIVDAFAAAARRALAAGFAVAEVHAAHGYLLNEFLSPIANRRTDGYGGSLENRMRLPLEVAEAVRATWPADKPVFVRISASDNADGGWTVEDSIVFATRLKAIGIDAIHVSSGGFAEGSIAPKPLYQVPFAAAIRRGADIATVAVGLVTTAAEAQSVLDEGAADVVALARPALEDPNFPLHARKALGETDPHAAYPRQAGYAVRAMDKALAAAG